MSRPEAAGWSVVILAAYGISASLLYLVYSQFFVGTPESAVFNQALETVREDFRVTALLGSTIKGPLPAAAMLVQCYQIRHARLVCTS